MTNSSLVSYTKISPNKTSPRNHKIDTITIHCVVGQCSIETLGNIFTPSSRKASSNYGVGPDGRIGMYVEEKDRSWCSSNAKNDHRAITIEVASDTFSPYAITSDAYEGLIKLLVDICKRNDIKELKWKNDKSLIGQPNKQNITVHRWFSKTSCPGDYIFNHLGKIAEEVNSKLNINKNITFSIKIGDIVSIKPNAKYYNQKDIPSWVKEKKWIVSDVSGDKVIIDKSLDGKNAINSPINIKFLILIENTSKKDIFKSYQVRINISDLNIRTGPGTNYNKTGKFTGKGVFTIIEEKVGEGSKLGWGRLKSGTGWISLDYATKL